MHDETENPFGSTIWSFVLFAVAAGALYALGLQWFAYVVVILGSLITAAITAGTIEDEAAPVDGRFSPAVGKGAAVVGFICKLAAIVVALSAILYGLYWAWTSGSLRSWCGSLCY
jgi:hypothetical protein